MKAYPFLRICVALTAVACSAQRETAKVHAAPPRVVRASQCPVTKSDLRIDSTSVGGLPTSITIGELLYACPFARLDTVGVGGTQAIAVTVDAPGAHLSAVQSRYEAYGDSLHPTERPDLWIAHGDSLRFADGTLVPHTVGALRALDSLAVVVIDNGDDGAGSYVARCRFPRVHLVVSNLWPPFAKAGVALFAKASTSDTTTIWRIEVDPVESSASIAAACRRGRIT